MTALGLAKTLFARVGTFRTQLWSTEVVDVRCGQFLDVVRGDEGTASCRWLADRDATRFAAIALAALDLSVSYRTVSETLLPGVIQIADPLYIETPAKKELDNASVVCRARP